MASGKRSFNLQFGGWGSYQKWAENGFTPKTTHEPAPQPEPPAEPGPAPAATEKAGDPARSAAVARAKNDAPKALPAGDRRPKKGPPVPPRPQPVDLYPKPPEVKRPNEPLIRPYILTGGRTRPRHDLDLHALVHTTEHGRTTTRTLPGEHETICRLCQSAHSVAEIAALVNVPLGVARILIDDMEEQNLISVTLPPQEDEHSIELLTRVLEGLRSL